MGGPEEVCDTMLMCIVTTLNQGMVGKTRMQFRVLSPELTCAVLEIRLEWNVCYNTIAGLRNGGGIGDVLRPRSKTEPLFAARVIYDLAFYFFVIIIVLNLIFGVIIDTFADLRAEKNDKEVYM